MKLTNKKVDSFDLEKEELEFLKKEKESLLESCKDLLRFGVPAYDQKGHFVNLQMKVRPLQMDMIAAIREKMPPEWFKSQSALCRSIVAIGCKVCFELLTMEKSEWHEILEGLNKIAKKHRQNEFKTEMEGLKNSIANSSIPPKEKVKCLDAVNMLEEKILQM